MAASAAWVTRWLWLALLCVWLSPAQEDDEEEELGNGLCWYNSNGRTYQRCCVEGDRDCWKGLGYTAELCCPQLAKEYYQCFDEIEARVEAKRRWLIDVQNKAEAVGDEEVFELTGKHIHSYSITLSTPLGLWSWACSSPASPLLWSEDCLCCEPKQTGCDEDPRAESTQILPEHVKCCYPVYARKTLSAPDEALEANLQAQLAELRPSRRAIMEHGPGLWWVKGGAEEAVREWVRKADSGVEELQLPNFSLARGCVVSILSDGTVQSCAEEIACHGFDCSFLRAFLAALEIIQATNPLPAMDLLISGADEIEGNTLAETPVFTRVGTSWTQSLALPAEWQLHPGQCVKQVKVGMLSSEQVSWEERKPELIWRGTNSNLWTPHCNIALAAADEEALRKCVSIPTDESRMPIWNMTTWLQLPRGRLVSLSRFFPYIDARFTRKRSTMSFMDQELEDFLVDEGLFAEHMTLETQSYYKYQIAIEGNSAADRISGQLFMGSVVLVPDGPWRVMSVIHMMEPFVHYVPVKYDLSDLVEKLMWLREHDAEAKLIAENGAAFAQQYLTCDNVLYYVDRLLRTYADRLTA